MRYQAFVRIICGFYRQTSIKLIYHTKKLVPMIIFICRFLLLIKKAGVSFHPPDHFYILILEILSEERKQIPTLFVPTGLQTPAAAASPWSWCVGGTACSTCRALRSSTTPAPGGNKGAPWGRTDWVCVSSFLFHCIYKVFQLPKTLFIQVVCFYSFRPAIGWRNRANLDE